MAEIRDSRSQALLDLILAYNEVATSRMNMELVQVFAETRVQFLDLVDQKLALGVSSQADLVRAEAKAYEAQESSRSGAETAGCRGPVYRIIRCDPTGATASLCATSQSTKLGRAWIND